MAVRLACSIRAGADGVAAILLRETCLTELNIAGTKLMSFRPHCQEDLRAECLTNRVRKQAEPGQYVEFTTRTSPSGRARTAGPFLYVHAYSMCVGGMGEEKRVVQNSPATLAAVLLRRQSLWRRRHERFGSGIRTAGIVEDTETGR